jgi:hypothetical protein
MHMSHDLGRQVVNCRDAQLSRSQTVSSNVTHPHRIWGKQTGESRRPNQDGLQQTMPTPSPIGQSSCLPRFLSSPPPPQAAPSRGRGAAGGPRNGDGDRQGLRDLPGRLLPPSCSGARPLAGVQRPVGCATSAGGGWAARGLELMEPRRSTPPDLRRGGSGPAACYSAWRRPGPAAGSTSRRSMARHTVAVGIKRRRVQLLSPHAATASRSSAVCAPWEGGGGVVVGTSRVMDGHGRNSLD